MIEGQFEYCSGGVGSLEASRARGLFLPPDGACFGLGDLTSKRAHHERRPTINTNLP